jgi:hypothetical protein
MTTLIDRIEELRELQPNWDSYGAYAISPESIERAKLFVSAVPWADGIPEPSVTASGDGHVGFTWAEKRWGMDLEILPDGTYDYYWYEVPEGKDKEGSTKDIDDIVALMNGDRR